VRPGTAIARLSGDVQYGWARPVGGSRAWPDHDLDVAPSSLAIRARRLATAVAADTISRS
jgi:hypothetical protein